MILMHFNSEFASLIKNEIQGLFQVSKNIFSINLRIEELNNLWTEVLLII